MKPFVTLLIASVLFSAAGQESQETQKLVLSQTAQACAGQLSKIIGVDSSIEQLRKLAPDINSNSSAALEAIFLNQRILARITDASLHIDAVVADIDDERAQVRTVQDFVTTQNDRSEKITDIANLVAAVGVGLVGDSLQFKSSTQTLGNAIQVGSSAADLGTNLFQTFRPKKKRAPVTIAPGFSPSMLAAVFSNPSPGPKEYPDVVWDYLTSDACSPRAIPWRDQLLQQWATLLGSHSSEPDPKDIAKLTNNLSSARKFDSGTLNDRAIMLGDLRARILWMKHALADLMDSVEPILSSSME